VIGASFGAFGWREPGFDWRGRTVVIDNRPWGRTMANRNVYVHEYARPLAIRRPMPGVAPHPEARPGVRPEARPEVRPAGRPEVRPEARPAARPEARPEAKQPARDTRTAAQKHKDEKDKKKVEEKKDERR
jgi:hypothetical protein